MSSMKLDRNKEKKEWERLRQVYGREPKEKCPKCHKKSLFMVNTENQIFCVRCDCMVGIKKAENKS